MFVQQHVWLAKRLSSNTTPWESFPWGVLTMSRACHRGKKRIKNCENWTEQKVKLCVFETTTKGSHIIPPPGRLLCQHQCGPLEKRIYPLLFKQFLVKHKKNKQKHRILNFSDLSSALQMHPSSHPPPQLLIKSQRLVWLLWTTVEECWCSRADSMEADPRLRQWVLHGSIYWGPLWFSSRGLHITLTREHRSGKADERCYSFRTSWRNQETTISVSAMKHLFKIGFKFSATSV